MINDEANNCHYFTLKIFSELNSSGWLRAKKEAIINDDADFEDGLDDALDYQTIEKNLERISKLKHINKYNWKGIDFPAGPKEWINFEKNDKTIALNILHMLCNIKTINIAYRSEHNNKQKNK